MLHLPSTSTLLTMSSTQHQQNRPAMDLMIRRERREIARSLGQDPRRAPLDGIFIVSRRVKLRRRCGREPRGTATLPVPVPRPLRLHHGPFVSYITGVPQKTMSPSRVHRWHNRGGNLAMLDISNVTTLSQAWGTGPGLIPPVDTVWAIRSQLDGRSHQRPRLTKAPQPGCLSIHAAARWVVCWSLSFKIHGAGDRHHAWMRLVCSCGSGLPRGSWRQKAEGEEPVFRIVAR